jgi:pimeloyl-ACP methyl ester carboxylesterase
VRRFLFLPVLILQLAACSSSSKSSETSTDAATTTTVAKTIAYTPKLEPRDCGLGGVKPLVEVTCSFLVVPEDRTKDNGRTVKLAVAKLHSKAKAPRPDPVVDLHGGPGGDGLSGIAGWSDAQFLEQRDIILYDQRGSGLSVPSLDCPEVNEAILERFTKTDSFEVELEARRAAVKACRARLVADGVDLNQYDSEVSATDLDDLRKALKVEKWNLLGVSYGSRLALTTMRSYPDGVRSVLLDSVYPTTVGGTQRQIDSGQRALDQLAAGCAANAACADKNGDLDATLQKAYETLNAKPYSGQVDLGQPNGTIDLNINGDDAIGGLFTAMYDHELIPALPGIIKQISDGNYAIIPAIAQQGIPFATQFAEGAAMSIDCADSGAVDAEGTKKAVADPGRWAVVVSESSQSYCDIWDVEPLPASFNEPVVSDLPALVLAGTYDPVTPPADSKAAYEALTNATFGEVDGIGHGAISSNECAYGVYQAFVADPTQKPDTSCIPKQPPPAFS